MILNLQKLKHMRKLGYINKKEVNMKKILLSLLLLICAQLYAGQLNVSYTGRAYLGDGLFYTFTFINTNATDSAFIKGSGNGFLVTNMNDRQITIEIYTSITDTNSMRWTAEVWGSHQAVESITYFRRVCSPKDFPHRRYAPVTFTAEEIGNYPYLIFLIRGTSGNAASQSVTVRIYFDYDEKYIGKE